jgi:hypothetical protein
LNASIGYDSDNERLLWGLDLHSVSISTPHGEPLSFGISCGGFTIQVSDWTELSGMEYEVPSERLEWGFQIDQWEELVALHLKFGSVSESNIEITATGFGLTESMPDLFPAGRVGFQIQTSVRFTGIGVLVPLNATDPIAYSLAKVRTGLPKYQFADPQIRETKDTNGKLLVVEALFPPKLA